MILAKKNCQSLSFTFFLWFGSLVGVFWVVLFYYFYHHTKDHEEEAVGPGDTTWLLNSSQYFHRSCGIQRTWCTCSPDRDQSSSKSRNAVTLSKILNQVYLWNNLIKWSWSQILSRTGGAEVWLKNGVGSHSLCRMRIWFHFLFWLKLRKCLCALEQGALGAGVRGTSPLCWDAHGWIAELQAALLLAWTTELQNQRVSAQTSAWLHLTLVPSVEELHIAILWPKWYLSPTLNNEAIQCLHILFYGTSTLLQQFSIVASKNELWIL